MHLRTSLLVLAAVAAAQPFSAASAPPCCVYTDSVWNCTGCGVGATPGPLSETHAPALLARQSSENNEQPGPITMYPPKTGGDTSNCGAVYVNNYDMGLHIASIFIILVTSALGVMFPIVTGWWAHRKGRDTSKLQNLDAASFGNGIGFWPSTFFLARHFGTGIIFSTTFIHLLDEGFAMFNDPCIGEMHFNATAPAIALAAAFLTFFFDFVGSRAAQRSVERSASARQDSDEFTDKDIAPTATGGAHDCSHAEALLREQEAWQVLLLEAGIIFHSVMVGVTLGAGSGHGWTTLMIVIVFHQVFEGAALGARIAVLHWLSRTRAFMYGMAFTIVTPLAMALGVGIRASFSQNGRAALLAVGVLDSLSAGILIYTAFKMLNSDFVDGPLRTAPASRVALAITMILIGCFLMSLLGKWA